MPKQAVFPCRITEECRQRLCSSLIVVLSMGMMCGTALIAVALYIRVRIRAKVRLIEGYDSDLLPITLLVVGSSTALLNIAAAKIVHEMSFSDKREKLRHVMLAMVVILCVVDVALLVGATMTFIQGHLLRKSFHNGLENAMISYKDDVHLKEEIDTLQMEFGCCGNNGYDDWFAIQWVSEEYTNTGSSGTQSKRSTDIAVERVSDDVPFSCCHPRSVRPCIHHRLLDNAAHYRYDFEQSYTIHRAGCKHRLMTYFNHRLNIIGGCVMGIFSLQLVALTMAQYLNSSICNALARGDPERTAKGWMFEEFPLVTAAKFIGGMILGV